MTKGNQQLYTVLILAIAFCGAFAFKGRSQIASFLQAKTDFIPDRCGTEAEDSTTPCNDQVRLGSKFPACVCFWNGTCEFRSDKTRCQWCNEEDAASVNAGERCPKLNGDLLYVCPLQQNIIVTDPIVVIGPELPLSVSPVQSAEETPEATAQPSNITIGPMQPAQPSNNLTVSAVTPVPVNPVQSAEETTEDTAQPVDMSIDTASEPVSTTTASKHRLSSTKRQVILSPPLKKAETTHGCICTADGVCKRQKVADWSSSCQNDQVVAVIEDGPCPKSSNCTLKPPSNAYKCQASDRAKPGVHKMCPMFVVLNGCVCYNDGTCVSKPTSSCASCQDDTVVSVTTNSQCDCV